MANPKKAQGERRRRFIAARTSETRRKIKLFDEVWSLYKQRMDGIEPGWDEDRLYVVKAKATLRQEFEAKFHDDIVVVPNLS